MVDILHRIGIEGSSPDDVYEALTTVEGLSSWWADDTTGVGDVGGVLKFRFQAGAIDMEVVELDPPERVRWRVVEQPEDWLGTTVDWEIRQDGDCTIVLFRHEGWKEPTEFMHHCSTKWALFLMSLKQLIETGEGAPEPRDVKIGDWG